MISCFRKKKFRPSLALLRDYEEELHAFVQAILSGEPEVEQRLARSLAQKPEHIRWAFIHQLRERVHDEKEHLAHGLEPMLKRQEERILADRNQRVNKWLAHMLPAFNRVRMLSTMQEHPALKQAITDVGRELQHEGIHNAQSTFETDPRTIALAAKSLSHHHTGKAHDLS